MAETVRRASGWRTALLCVVAIELLGGLSGWLSNSGYGNWWFDALQKPAFMPPGYLFGIVWPILYALLGIVLALVLAKPPSERRRTALVLFAIQMVLNFAWSPIFFAYHDVALAKYVIIAMLVIAAVAAILFFRLRPPAALLMVPYLCWLVFAATLNAKIDELNPDAKHQSYTIYFHG